MRHYERNRRRCRVAWSAGTVLSLAFGAGAQSTAGFPPVDGPPTRSPSPSPSPSPPQPAAPPSPYPAPPPSPPQYQYQPPALAPQHPPSGGPTPYFPGALPMYPAPVMPAPVAPPNPLLDEGFRYRQVLGAYHRTATAADADPRSKRVGYRRLVDGSRYHHDGLYFRFAGGLGFGHDAVKSNRTLPSSEEFSFALTPLDGSGGGMAAVTEIAIGYTAAAGVALGFGIYTATIPAFSVDVTDPHTGSYAYRLSQLAVIGPVADWYFFPDAGFHAQVSPGVGTYVAGAAEPTISGPQAQAHTAVGFGFMLGLGYEWWIAQEWSMGFLGRVTYGSLSGSDNRGVSWTHTAYAPALLISATYN